MFQNHKFPQRLTPDRATEFERIWQHGLATCLDWRLTDEQYRAALTDFVLVEGYGPVLARLRIANRLQSHFAFLTYTVAGRYAVEHNLDAEGRHETWRFCWHKLNTLLRYHPTMPEWLIELALEDGVKRLRRPARVEPVAPELETELAAVLARESLDWDILSRKLGGQTEREIAAGIGKSKTKVHNEINRMRSRAQRIGVMP